MPTILNLDLGELLLRPRETLDIEIKEWLDLTSHNQRANVAKEIIALANHGGGFLVIGLQEDVGGQFQPALHRPPNLYAWSQDDIQGIIRKYIEPPFQCQVAHL